MPIVVAPSEFVHVERQILFAHLMKTPHDAALEKRLQNDSIVFVWILPRTYSSAFDD